MITAGFAYRRKTFCLQAQDVLPIGASSSEPDSLPARTGLERRETLTPPPLTAYRVRTMTSRPKKRAGIPAGPTL